MDYSEAFARVEAEEDYIVDVLQRMIAVDTSVPPGENYAKLIDVVEPEFKRFNFETQRVVVPKDKVALISRELSGERCNLVASLKNGKPKASAYAHMDVVPVDDPWTVDPFAGVVRDGKLYGRGTVDMKGSIACYLGAVKVLHDLAIEPHYELDCLLCTDEEIGVYPGSRYLAEEGYFSSHLVWLELGAVDPVVVVGAAGAVDVKVAGYGKSCHSGMNYLGVNAIEEMVPILQELLTLKEKVQKRLSRIPSFPIPGYLHDKMTPMFSLTVMQGGTKDNIVPGECRLTINRRYLVDERFEDVVAEIQEAVERGRRKSKLIDVKTEFSLSYGPVEIDPQSPASKKMRAAATAVYGYTDFLYGGISASTDLAMVADALKPAKLDVACFGVERAEDIRAHAADEFVYIEDLVSMTKQLVHYFAF
ncbi:MAG: ArgE/DapE family deacylase [Deltaproteobacteria bacterium]|nr:ArgE/DapE family deacylase [Deltaproteobacteria bacterium]